MPTCKIFIVEDDSAIADMAAMSLSKAGYEISGKFDRGEDAIIAAATNKPDIALMDLTLAGQLGGLDTGKKLQSEMSIPVVYMTGDHDTQTIDMIMQAGAIAFLLKPFKLTTLKITVALALRSISLQKELERSKVHYSEIFKNAISGIAVLRAIDDGNNFEFIEANDAVIRIESLTSDQILGKKLTDIFPAAEKTGLLGVVRRVWADGKSERISTTHYENERISGWRSCYIYRLPTGEVVIMYRDETLNKARENMLEQSLYDATVREVEATSLLDGTKAILSCDDFTKTARILFDKCKKLTGATAGYVAMLSEDGMENEVLFLDSGGQACTVDPNLPMPIRGLRSEVYKSGEVKFCNDFANSEWVKFMPPGHAKLENVLFAPMKIHDSVAGLMGLSNKPGGFTKNDVRICQMFGELLAIAYNNHCNREMVKNSESYLRTILNSVKDGVAVFDKEMVCKFWNNYMEKLTGITSEQAIGKDVSKKLCEIGIDLNEHNQFYAALSGKVTNIAERQYHIERGTRQEWLLGRLSPLKDASGNVLGAVASFRDITDRKNLETQLLQSQKLESIGELAAGIAHEINTPTQFVGDNARFLQDAFKDILAVMQMYRQIAKSPGLDESAKKLLEQIAAAEKKVEIDYLLGEIPTSIFQSLEGVERISKIVLAMKEFSHPGGILKKAADINRALQNTITVARNEWKYVADIETNFAHDLPALQCFPGELNQVFLNIIVNAAQAIGEFHRTKPDKTVQKGRITISTRKDGQFIEIRIADDGPGIPKNIQHKIFDPFFTTKEVGKGTGQGLAIAHSVITDKHGGTITVDSEIGKGTAFVIRLPIE